MQVHLTKQNETGLKVLAETWQRSVAFFANQMIAESLASRAAQERYHKARYNSASKNVVQSKNRFKKFTIKP